MCLVCSNDTHSGVSIYETYPQIWKNHPLFRRPPRERLVILRKFHTFYFFLSQFLRKFQRKFWQKMFYKVDFQTISEHIQPIKSKIFAPAARRRQKVFKFVPPKLTIFRVWKKIFNFWNIFCDQKVWNGFTKKYLKLIKVSIEYLFRPAPSCSKMPFS